MPQVDIIDTSHFQTLAGLLQPLAGAITKVSEGDGFRDPKGLQFRNAYRQAGYRYRGAYHFVTDDDADAQLANFAGAVEATGGFGVGDFWMCDWERMVNGQFPPTQTVLDFLALCRQRWPGRGARYGAPWVAGWSTWFNQPSREPLIYASYAAAIRNGLNADDAQKHTDDAPYYDAFLVQWTDAATVQGIVGPVDASQIVYSPILESVCGYNPPVVPDSTPAVEHTDTLNAPDALRPWDVLVSGNGIWTARMQADGNLVVLAYNKPVWNSHTAGNSGAELQFGGDGNLLLCLPNKPLWSSWTPTGATRLVMQNDGNLVTYNGTKPTWSIWTGPLK